MSKRDEIKRKREILEALKSGKPAKKEKAKKKEKQKEIDADGKVDDEDLSLARKAVEVVKKKAKKIVKKKDK